MSLPIYPFLLAAYSVLSLYAANLGEMYGTDAVAPLAAILAFAALAFVASRWLVGDAHRGAFVCFVGLAGLLYYGDLQEGLSALSGRAVSGAPLLGALAVLVLALLFRLRRARRSFAALSLTLNAAVAAPLVASLVEIAWFNLSSPYPESIDAAQPNLDEAARLAGGQAARKPSVFYLIFDRYGGGEVLRRQYGYDNEPFLQALRQRGFFVVENSSSNYPSTPLSLASSLNGMHLGDLARAMGPDSTDRRPYFDLIRHSAVARAFHTAGYTHVSLGSYWEPTRTAPAADENYAFDRLSDFGRLYLSKTAFRVLARIYDPGLSRTANCARVNYQFDRLEELATRREATFVLGHFLIPHPPYTFAHDGRCTSEEEERARPTAENYLEQLRYANARILQFVDRALAGPGPKPIIVLQADEGPYPERLAHSEKTFDWRTATDAEVARKFGILSSYYFPDGDYSTLYDGITPVNTFRVILGKLSGADVALLPDESYVYAETDRPYDLLPVTRRLSRR